jgi:basic membrane lipoprotein Med (substrate-binding protein (PBP1-ABC) superfamily)/DNA-binding SARP family transcriptional activator
MQYRILGPLEVVDDTGSPAPGLGPPKQRALLALLVLRVGEVVPADRIIELLWGGRPPRTAGHSVQVYVSELRRCLTDPHGDPIETRGGGYLLRADPEQVDSRHFARLVGAGQQLLRTDRPAEAAAAFEEGLALWRGPVLVDVAAEDFAQQHIQELDGLRVDAMECLADARLTTGDSAAALPVLVAAISADPLRERSRALLMLALYRAGRHPEALRSYQRFRGLLADELGIDPSPDLRRLHERILLHDPGLLPDSAADDDRGPAPARNPYKGLRPFAEPDAPDFFGRTGLIERVLDELRLGTRLLTLVGPSGSGKSSLVAAGVLPRLRAGAVPGSEAWRVVPVLPDEVGASHLEQLVQSPVDGTTVLVIDQLEELFLHPDAAVTGSFLRALTALVTSPAGGTRAVVTLRADFYDRPLQHRDLAEAFLAGVVTVLPLSAADLEQAVVRPAARVGAGIEQGLVAALVSEAVDRPGALPLLQYALTELFDRSGGGQMTASAYHEIGGLRGALLRRAERLYTSLDPGQQDVATEVMLRLVRVVPGERDSRRRVPISDLSGTDLDPVALSEVLEQLARHRLISLDRDAETAEGTIELAHEALLWEWDRYAGWVERHRAALGERDALLRAVEEWESSGKDADFLLKGRRLEKFATWSAQAGLRMTAREEELLAASLALERSEAAQRIEQERAVRRQQRRSRRRVIALAVAVVLLGTAAGAAALTTRPGTAPDAPRIGLLFSNAGTEVDASIRAAFDHAVAAYDLTPVVRVAEPEEAVPALRRLSAEQVDLILVCTIQTDVDAVARRHPGIRYVVIDHVSAEPNVTSLVSEDEQGSYLAGAAAALTSRSGTIGFIGGVKGEVIGRFQAGYVAGARAVDPAIDVLVDYLSIPPDLNGFVDQPAGQRAATAMYRAGADVVFAAAGQSGLGVFEAAAALSDGRRGQLWAIGVDSDQYDTVQSLPGVVDPARWQRHILTSVTKSFEDSIYDVLTAHAEGTLAPGVRAVGLSTGAVDISWSGGFLAGARTQIETLRQRIVAGQLVVPHVP